MDSVKRWRWGALRIPRQKYPFLASSCRKNNEFDVKSLNCHANKSLFSQFHSLTHIYSEWENGNKWKSEATMNAL